jgi:hypothetical protein
VQRPTPVTVQDFPKTVVVAAAATAKATTGLLGGWWHSNYPHQKQQQ